MATRKRQPGLIWRDEATAIVQDDIHLAGEIFMRFYAADRGVEWDALENPLAENIAQMLIAAREEDRIKWEAVSKERAAAGRARWQHGYVDNRPNPRC